MGLSDIVCGVIATGTLGFGLYSGIKFTEDLQNYHLAATAGVCLLVSGALVNRTMALYNKNKREKMRESGKGSYTDRFTRP